MQSAQSIMQVADVGQDHSNQNILSHMHSQDPAFNIPHHSQSFFPGSNSTNMLAGISEYDPDLEAHNQAPLKNNGFVTNSYGRTPFSSFSGSSRNRQPTQIVPNFRDSQAYYGSDYTPLTSPTQAPTQPFDSRGGFDYVPLQGPVTTGSQKSGYGGMEYIPSQNIASKASHGAQINGYGPTNPGYSSSIHFSSQTPFGPHVPSGATANNAPNVNAGMPPVSGNMSMPNANAPHSEDISTIFVVGFPDDMQEREFQNMFTFSPGFEAATLKIPNKESTSYANGVPNGTTTSNSRQPFAYNDPYNTAQNNSMVDPRAGDIALWSGDDNNGGVQPHFNGGSNVPPRKQIIGFAKFKTREEALTARDILQGRRVDMDKGAVLKAEMAKKNLHTKRGVGPIPGPTIGLGQVFPGGNGVPMISPSGNMMNQEVYMERDPNVNYNRMSQWRDQVPEMIPQPPIRDDEDRRMATLGAMGLSRRAEEEDRERRRQNRLRAGNVNAYDAFHSVPIQTFTNGSILMSPPMGSRSALSSNDSSLVTPVNEFRDGAQSGPWDHVRNDLDPNMMAIRTSPPPNPHSSDRSSSDKGDMEGSDAHSRRSSASADTGHTSDSSKMPYVNNLAKTVGGLSLAARQGNTSPQLPSPVSGGSSSSLRNGIDQYPAINTLYVGNLPTSQCPPDVLEASLKELFTIQPGFRRLSYRQKGGGPMCFVEFEDVNYAAKSKAELAGHSLNGLVKGNGIRLSYSKNPLGVRTPTSAHSSGSVLQQQQGLVNGIPDDTTPRFDRRDSNAQTPLFMSSPPPRFASPSASFTPQSFSSGFTTRNVNGVSINPSTFHNFSVTSNTPAGDSHLSDAYHFMNQDVSSPTLSNLEPPGPRNT